MDADIIDDKWRLIIVKLPGVRGLWSTKLIKYYKFSFYLKENHTSVLERLIDKRGLGK